MNNKPQASFSYLFWPLAVLLFLTVGVFLTAREIPQEQDIRSRAQFLQNPSLFPTEFFDENTSPSPDPTSTPENAGPTLSLSFSLPGISSLGGNLKPLHPTRDISLFLYDQDSNTSDASVKPLHIIQTTATFDDKPASPTYTRFVSTISLGDKVAENDYQIGLKTNQAFMKVSKLKDSDLNGILYAIDPTANVSVRFSNLLVGDIVPTPGGDNAIDIADYNALMNCFETRASSADCIVKTEADLDDNGIIDGIDYNLMLRSFQSLLALGITPPVSLSPTVQPSPTAVRQPSPTPSIPPESGSGVGVLMVLVLFVLLALGIALALRKKLPFLDKFHKSSLEDKEYYIKKKSQDETGTWVTLTDDNGQTRGHYFGTDVKDGFAHIQGSMKKEADKEFIEITKIIWEEEA